MCLAFKAVVDVYFFAGTSGQFCSPDISGIKEDIAIIQSTLEQKLTEGRTISGELDRAKKEKKTLAQENLRLNHRIAYLEDQTNELQEGLRQVRDSLSRTLNTTDIIQVSLHGDTEILSSCLQIFVNQSIQFICALACACRNDILYLSGYHSAGCWK